MTEAGAKPPAASTPAPSLVTAQNLWAITLCCVVATVGLSGDIGRHLRNGTSLTSDFWASWHLVLYAGVLGLAGWLGRMALIHGPKPMRAAFRPTIFGVFVLCIGGLCDWAWHSIFGIEVSIPALLSPPHLMLMTGLVLVLMGPVAALWREPAGDRLAWPSAACVVVCTICLTVVVTVFTGYLSVFSSDIVVNGYLNPMVGTQLDSTEVIHGVATMIWTSLVMTVPWLVLRLRWRLRPGMMALTICTLAITSHFAVQGLASEVVSATLGAGLVIDAVVSILTRDWDTDKALVAIAIITPVTLWTMTFMALRFSDRLVWGTTLSGGGTVLSTLITVAFAGLIVLARRVGANLALTQGAGGAGK